MLLNGAQVDFERSLISLENTKSGYPRLVPMSSLAHQTLLKVRGTGDGELVFGLSANALRMSFCRLRKAQSAPCALPRPETRGYKQAVRKRADTARGRLD